MTGMWVLPGWCLLCYNFEFIFSFIISLGILSSWSAATFSNSILLLNLVFKFFGQRLSEKLWKTIFTEPWILGLAMRTCYRYHWVPYFRDQLLKCLLHKGCMSSLSTIILVLKRSYILKHLFQVFFMRLLHLIELLLYLVEIFSQVSLFLMVIFVIGKTIQLILKELKSLRIKQLLLTKELDVFGSLHKVLFDPLWGDYLTCL